MNNREIANIMFNIATLLERQHSNPYRIRRYREVAQAILRLPHALAERALAGEPLGIPNLGSSLTRKITVLAAIGQLDFYDELCAELPPAQQRLMKVPGIGPILAERIGQELGDADLSSLLREAAARRLQQVWGVGPQRSAAILQALYPDESPEPPPAAAAQQPPRGRIISTQPTLWDYRPPTSKAA